MKQVLSTIISLLFLSSVGFSQNIGIGTNTPHPSAALEIADSSKGILIPRMTMAQRNAIQNPAEGLMVYQMDSTYGNWVFSHGQWRSTQPTNANPTTNTLNLTDGFTITNGTFSPPSGRRWKVESINVINDSHTYNLTAPFARCSTTVSYGMQFYYCIYHFSGFQVLKIGSLTASIPSSDNQDIAGTGACNCPSSPLSFTNTINSTFFDKIKLPIWVNSIETIEIQNGIVLSISEYQ